MEENRIASIIYETHRVQETNKLQYTLVFFFSFINNWHNLRIKSTATTTQQVQCVTNDAHQTGHPAELGRNHALCFPSATVMQVRPT